MMFILDIVCYFCQEKVGKIAIFGEVGAIFEVDKGDFGVDGGLFGLFGELDEGMVGFGKVVVDEIRSGGTEETGGFCLAGDETGEAEGGIARGVFLVIGGFVGFVDDDEAEVVDWGEEGGAGADDDGFGVGELRSISGV